MTTTARNDVAAEIAHTLTCLRCRMDWSCNGLSADDYGLGERIAGLLDDAAADERQAAAQRVHAAGTELAAEHHVAGTEHGRIMALTRVLAAAAGGAL